MSGQARRGGTLTLETASDGGLKRGVRFPPPHGRPQNTRGAVFWAARRAREGRGMVQASR